MCNQFDDLDLSPLVDTLLKLNVTSERLHHGTVCLLSLTPIALGRVSPVVPYWHPGKADLIALRKNRRAGSFERKPNEIIPLCPFFHLVVPLN